MWTTPLEIYVAYAPQSERGASLAHALADWFTGERQDPLKNGPGIPLSYRSTPGDDGGDHLDIRWSTSRYSVLLVLVDDAMVARGGQWRDWLERMVDEAGRAPEERLVLLCALTPAFTNLSRKLAATQAIRVDKLVEDPEAQVHELAARLANEICRLIDPQREDGQPTKLFISHAKSDGRDAAQDLKKYVDNSPAGEVFFDEVSLQPGREFDDGFRSAIAGATLVILLTDAWASRYWCQWEALQCKELERPLLLVDMLSQGEPRHFPYLGNAPMLRCEPGRLDDATCRRVLRAAQLETLRDLHEQLLMQALGEDNRLPQGAIHLTRAPELATVVTRFSREASATRDSGKVLVYPEPPIALHEQRLIRRYDESLVLATPIELLGPQTQEDSLKGRVVAISISDSPELDRFGFEKAHLDRVWVALTRHLLALDAGVAYGGDLRAGGFTEILMNLVRAYVDEGRLLAERLVHWHVAWPISVQLTDQVRAKLPDVIEVHAVGKPADVDADESAFVPPQENQYAWLRSLTEMRREMVATSDARVLIGGQRTASTPRSGIAEEFSLSLRAGQPLYLCGAFGGMTADLIEVVRGNPTPVALTSEFQIDTPERERVVSEYNASVAGSADPISYEALVTEIRAAGVEGLRNGLNAEENEQLFASHSVEEIVGLIRKGLNNVIWPDRT